MINRSVFYDHVRGTVFGGRISPDQFDGTEVLLDIWQMHYPDLVDAGFAYILATCFHESAQRMQPVNETLAATDDAVIRILDRAWANGQLKGVRAPYWRRDADGKAWFGRGIVQLTLKDNYRRLGNWLRDKAGIDVDLVADPKKALDPDISARILFEGVIHGLFRNGHWLGKYIDADRSDFVGARNIVNGAFRDDAERIASIAGAFASAISKARRSGRPGDASPQVAPPAQALDLAGLHAEIAAKTGHLPEGSIRQAMQLALAIRLLAIPPPETRLELKPEKPANPAGFLLPPPERNVAMNREKHPLRSKTIHGALTALFGMALPALAPLAGFAFTADDGREVLDALSQMLTAAGVLYAIYGRVVATRRISI
jgi:hypothetical protein